ncbi:hypothetical protein EK904_014314 [Melospiza melodia maxima]|nr:hypothetical protein EK904_014314 [Melospiza melodia maxima]
MLAASHPLEAVPEVTRVCVCLCIDLSLLRFISAELTRGYFLEHNEAKYTERRERVYTCMRIPKELEKNTALICSASILENPESAQGQKGSFITKDERAVEEEGRVGRIPLLMFFGIFLCLDAFLYVFTLLPLRVFLAMFRFITLPCYGLRIKDSLFQPNRREEHFHFLYRMECGVTGFLLGE